MTLHLQEGAPISKVPKRSVKSARKPAPSPITLACRFLMAEDDPDEVTAAALFEKVQKARQKHPLSFSAADYSLHNLITSSAISGLFLRNFKHAFALSRESMAALLGTTPKTVRAREAEERLPTSDIEKLVRYVRVWTAASLVFEDHDMAMDWMERPSEALGDQRPLDLIATGEGERLVLDELGRMEHGLPV